MANMSYCRFQNTAHDLKDCLIAIDNNECQNLSREEIRALEELRELAEELIDKHYEIDEIIIQSNQS